MEPSRRRERDRERLEHAYRAALKTDPAAGRAVRRFCLVAIAINALVLPVEQRVLEEMFSTVALIHAGGIAALLYVYAFLSRSRPILGAQVLQLVIGALLVVIVTLSEKGIASEYARGLIFSFCAFPIAAPLSVRQISFTILPTITAFMIVPQWRTPVDVNTYWLHAIFPIIGAIAGLGSTTVLDAIRFSEFERRAELERARDDLKALDAAKSRFTANVHHELRTPLTLVLAPLEAMLAGAMGEIPDALRPMLESMRSNGVRLLKLINDLLDLSRIESQQMKIRRRPLQLERIVADIVRGAGGMAQRKRIDLRFESNPELPIVYADADAIEKIVVNLVGNALKFTDGGGRVDVTLQPTPSGIRLSVLDTGIGVPEDQLGKIFDRFAQVDMSDGRSYEGTGIGLSLVRELVELHGGRVSAESEGPGRGTQFHVEIPVGESDATAEPSDSDDGAVEERATDGSGPSLHALGRELLAETEADRTSESRASESSASEFGAPETGDEPEPHAFRRSDALLCGLDDEVRRWELDREALSAEATRGEDRAEVLIVEDNGDMRELLRTLLEREFRVRLARNGLEGLEAVQEHRPDVVVSDVMMPGMTGLELTTAIKERPETASIPVILVTSKAEREMRAEGLERGADDYVAKPFHPRELQARVRTFARLGRLRRALEQRHDALESALAELRRTQMQLVQREKMAALGQLVAGVAHEINNPLNFIQGNLEFLQDDIAALRKAVDAYAELASRHSMPEAISADAVEAASLHEATHELETVLGGIRDGVQRTARIVRDLRSFSRVGSSEMSDASIAEGLECTLNLLRGRLRDVEVVREYADLPPVRCLAGQLNQVFMSLLTNAADALDARAGGRRIIVRTGHCDGDRVFVEVEDNGGGIAPEIADKIFDPFFTTKRGGKGAGLGLAIGLGIVQRHGGVLSVQSEPGRGTCARVELPMQLEESLPRDVAP